MKNGLDNRVVLDDGTVGWDDGSGQPKFRYGWDSLRALGRKLCSLINATQALILRGFGDNQIVVVLVELIGLVCPLIDDVATEFAEGRDGSNLNTSLQQLATDLRAIADKAEGSVQ